MNSDAGVAKSREEVSRGLLICPNCKSAAQLEKGLCLNCLLRGALEDHATDAANESFKETLGALKIQNGHGRCGEYEILEEIGRGGMAVIFRARELRSGRIVALKRAKADYLDSDQALARFRREAETAATLNHPNIVPVYFVGENEQGVPFFTMKLALGGNLVQARDVLRSQPRQSVLIMTKVALAVQYAHGRGVLHRDLKPGNILLEDPWEPLVSDFGLARWQNDSSRFTHTLTSFGTPGYLAPEQALGSQTGLTPAADVYSLGAILFELLTGRPPFLGENPLAVIQQAAEKSAPKLRQLASGIDRDLETICARCLEREPSARYQSAGDLAYDLERWLQGHPIMARPVGIRVRLGRSLKRHPLRATALGAALLLVGASLFWQVHGWKLHAAAQENALAARSVLVMPFLDLDAVRANPSLGQSMVSGLRQQLSAIGPVQIKSAENGPSFSWENPDEILRMGRAAKTRTLLSGTERLRDGKRRIAMRLLDAATGEPLFIHIWEVPAGTGAPKFGDAKVSRDLYGILSAKDWSNVLPSKTDPGLSNPASREAILASREVLFRYTASDVDHAIALLRRAIQLEPESSLAHTYMAIAATGRTHYIADRSFLELGAEEARHAIKLSPTSSDAHRALAGTYYQEGQFSKALEEALQTVETGGLEEKVTCLIGLSLDTLGRANEALLWYYISSRLERSPGQVQPLIGDCWLKLGDDEQAAKAYSRAMELQPDSPLGATGNAHMLMLEGNFDAARELCQRGRWNRDDLGVTQQMAAQIEFFARDFVRAENFYRQLSGTDPNGGGAFHGAMTYQSALGRAKQALGDKVVAKALLDRCLMEERAVVAREPENPEAAYRLAAVEASLGMRPAALQHLRTAIAFGWIDYRSLKMDPRFDSLRQSDEFELILKDLSAKAANMRVKARASVEIAQK